ncbi:DUF979 domain-containing protein [Caulobacter mirabilis]|uniref:Permease n=1 Tax=Caulobacter mirabilis TaxID=69666 RepID=A0A2D2B152_9CAUL|nr:DUF979 domain-containing protein [Caulobacter mirabilis]ATQ43962.1 hypothetical protein CSW64_16975 [Caulobacter mirabilis]
MIGLSVLYVVAGLMFALFAIGSATDRTNPRRWGNTAFWTLFAVSFLAGSWLPDVVNGLILVAMALVAGFNWMGRGQPAPQTDRAERAERWGDRLFVPALIPPIVTLAGTLWLKHVSIGGQPLVDPKQVTLISLGAGILLATATAMIMFRARPAVALSEGRRLMDSVGWAALLPQALAALGAVFAVAKVGDVIGGIATDWLPLDGPLASVCAYTLGMALFTMVMGNAFAAFPVMTAAIALPLIIGKHGGDPAIVCAIGMLSGFCGTLMTPMAANFNIVPAALLELPDRNGVIRAQIPTALILLIANTVLMYVLAFRF